MVMAATAPEDPECGLHATSELQKHDPSFSRCALD